MYLIMSVYKDKRTGSWCYKFIYKGVQYHRCFKDSTKDEVVGYECVAKSELRKSHYDIAADKHDYTLSGNYGNNCFPRLQRYQSGHIPSGMLDIHCYQNSIHPRILYNVH